MEHGATELSSGPDRSAPRATRSEPEGERIAFAIGRCSLGLVLLAATAKGVCAVEFGDDAERMAVDFSKRFPGAQPAGDREDVKALLDKIVDFIENPKAGLDLPVDVRGTAFQRKVWRALSAIPPGRTISYGELAATIGEPRAARAVAAACAANSVALAIPCHRVVRTSGALSGYRWGAGRKRTLLEREKAALAY